MFSAFDVAVDLAVCKVVNHAATGPGQDDAEDENQQVAQGGHPFSGNPQRPQGGPQQQVNADGFVHARQLDEVPCAGVQAIERFEQTHVHQLVSGRALTAAHRLGKNTSATSTLNDPRIKRERRAHRLSVRSASGNQSRG